MTDKQMIIKNLNSGVKCNPDCPLHKLITHNTCICCKAFKDSPYHKDYFNGLTYKDIAELAKKSIRLTAENRKLEDEIEKLRGEKE